ncbi:MAG: barstar family protein [Gemmataceae bacterium]
MNLSGLARPGTPHFHWAVGRSSDAYDAVRSLNAVNPGFVSRVVRGKKSTTKGALLDELSAALQFGPHFGENWDALNDELCDPQWASTSGLALGILDAGHVLAKSGSDDLTRLVEVLEAVAIHWAKGKRPHAFNIMLHAEASDAAAAEKRWAVAGAKTK